MSQKLMQFMFGTAIALGSSSLALAQAMPSSPPAQTAPATKPDKASSAFLMKAIQGNLSEVDLGKLAQQKSTNDQVKAFGQMLETDHSQANQRANEVAGAIGVTSPTTVTRQEKAIYNRMARLSGARFDTEFVRHMVADHKKDVREYEKETKAKNEQVAAYARDTLPTLRKHLDTANGLHPKMSMVH